MKKIFYLSTLPVSMLYLGVAKAQNNNAAVTEIGEFEKIGDYVSTLINTLMPYIATLAVIMVIYAGFLYMTAGGNQKKADEAKEIIIGIAVGILVLFSIRLLLNNILGAQI